MPIVGNKKILVVVMVECYLNLPAQLTDILLW